MSRDILLSLIDPDPSQPRKTFDEGALDELAQSMAANGLAVAVLVRPAGDRYLLVHGERRWRAAGRLGWQTIPAEVRDLDPEQARWLALVENIQRADLSPIDEARAYQAALSEGLTQTALGQKVGKSQSYIAQKLRLLGLPEPLQFYLDRLAISEGHARQLLRLRNFYGPDLMTGRAWPKAGDVLGLDVWKDAGNAAMLFLALRPLDALLWYSDPVPDVLAEGCQALAVWWESKGGQVPQWAVTAFWYASFVAELGFSVADLKAWLDKTEDILYSAVVWLQGRNEAPRGKLDQLMYWGYLSDLRHSGVPQWAKDPPKVVFLAASQHVLETNFYTAPSNCQPYGVNAAKWTELAARQDGWTAGDPWAWKDESFYPEFMRQVTDLSQQLNEAQDLPEVLAIRDQAAALQQEAAEFTLRNERAAGQALLELQAAEALL